jgi:hypothetical protein
MIFSLLHSLLLVFSRHRAEERVKGLIVTVGIVGKTRGLVLLCNRLKNLEKIPAYMSGPGGRRREGCGGGAGAAVRPSRGSGIAATLTAIQRGSMSYCRVKPLVLSADLYYNEITNYGR